MVAIDFPAAPINGQQFTPATGITYRYVTPPGIWTVAQGPVDTVIASDTPPANPVPNQLWFNAALAMLYVYYDDGTSQQWVPCAPIPAPPGYVPPPRVGDFFAIMSSTYTPPTTPARIPFDTIKSGNSGGWLNISASAGRFTPPAGRYYLFASMTCIDQSATVTSIALDLRKNGGGGFANAQTTVSGNQYTEAVTVSATLDANGTDYFEIYGSQSVVAANSPSALVWFGAFPLWGS
jgi:hypothetical protein